MNLYVCHVLHWSSTTCIPGIVFLKSVNTRCPKVLTKLKAQNTTTQSSRCVLYTHTFNPLHFPVLHRYPATHTWLCASLCLHTRINIFEKVKPNQEVDDLDRSHCLIFDPNVGPLHPDLFLFWTPDAFPTPRLQPSTDLFHRTTVGE